MITYTNKIDKKTKVLYNRHKRKQNSIKQNIKIETSQETKKNTNTKVKTGDHTKYMVYMGLIGLSLLGAYCIIMKNYIH